MTTGKSGITVRLARSEDRRAWDVYVLNHSESSPYHLFAWKEAVEASYRHHCYYFCAEKDGLVVGVLPLIHFYLAGVINEITALPYCDIGGCLSNDQMIQDRLLAAALDLRRTLKCRKLKLRGQLLDTELKNKALAKESSEKVRMFLDLPETSAELLSSFKSKLRNQINKAERNGILFRWGGPEETKAFYPVFAHNMQALGSPVHSRKWLAAVLACYGERARVGIVELNGKVVGMGIILIGGTYVSVPWASTLRAYNGLQPNMLLYWNFLKFSADHGAKRFDFGRSTLDEGTYNFKKQWGARPEPLIWYRAKIGKPVGQSVRPGWRSSFAAELWRHLPLWVANLLGPPLRKYINL